MNEASVQIRTDFYSAFPLLHLDSLTHLSPRARLQNVCIYIHNGILFIHKEERYLAICDDMDGP